MLIGPAKIGKDIIRTETLSCYTSPVVTDFFDCRFVRPLFFRLRFPTPDFPTLDLFDPRLFRPPMFSTPRRICYERCKHLLFQRYIYEQWSLKLAENIHNECWCEYWSGVSSVSQWQASSCTVFATIFCADIGPEYFL